MNKLSFEELPQAVTEIFAKLTTIEQILTTNHGKTSNVVDELLTIQQAAELLSLSVPTLYGYVHRQEIPNHKNKKRLYFMRAELMEWVKNGRRKTVEEINASAEILLKKRK